MANLDLSAKVLVMIVGPSAIGKSTLMNEIVRRDERFSRVRSFTTRPPRNNDEPGHYLYMTNDERLAQQVSGDIVTDVLFPTTGYHYGTVAKSYGSGYNLLDTLAHSVDEYEQLPFKRTVTISLTTNPDTWQNWLTMRFPSGGSDMKLRLEEAVASIEWSVAQTDNHYWIVNEPGDVVGTAERLITLATAEDASTSQPPQAKLILERAKLLLSYE
ncbi:MAG: hypothetical protein V4678_03250 [Patescibacteria group bacterium]